MKECRRGLSYCYKISDGMDWWFNSLFITRREHRDCPPVQEQIRGGEAGG